MRCGSATIPLRKFDLQPSASWRAAIRRRDSPGLPVCFLLYYSSRFLLLPVLARFSCASVVILECFISEILSTTRNPHLPYRAAAHFPPIGFRQARNRRASAEIDIRRRGCRTTGRRHHTKDQGPRRVSQGSPLHHHRAMEVCARSGNILNTDENTDVAFQHRQDTNRPRPKPRVNGLLRLLPKPRTNGTSLSSNNSNPEVITQARMVPCLGGMPRPSR